MKKKENESKKLYTKPKLIKLGNMVKTTLPGGSKGAEGGSGKGHNT